MSLTYIQRKVAADELKRMWDILTGIAAVEVDIDAAQALIEKDPSLTWTTDLTAYVANVETVIDAVRKYEDYLTELRKLYEVNAFEKGAV